MGIEDITLREVDDNGRIFRADNGQVYVDEDYVNKVMRFRVVKDTGPVSLDGDKLFIDIMEVYEDFESQVQQKVGCAQEYHQSFACGECEACKASPDDEDDAPCTSPQCEEGEGSTAQKMLGSMEFNLDEVIEALQLLKKHAH